MTQAALTLFLSCLESSALFSYWNAPEKNSNGFFLTFGASCRAPLGNIWDRNSSCCLKSPSGSQLGLYLMEIQLFSSCPFPNSQQKPGSCCSLLGHRPQALPSLLLQLSTSVLGALVPSPSQPGSSGSIPIPAKPSPKLCLLPGILQAAPGDILWAHVPLF